MLLIAAFSLVLFIESSIPYIYAERKTAPGNTFLGQIIYTPDQDMYFSFIRQAHDGNFLMNNRLTYIPNKPVFVNLEFWLIGAIQRITGMSDNAVYNTWRYLGILLLTIGIFMMARIVLPTVQKVLACTVILLFTGGFGFIFAALNSAHLISLDTAHSGMLDMRSGFLPLQQATTNPHFSLPHGLILIAYALFLIGEKENKTSRYFLSGLLFMIIGLVRPYDIIPPVVIFPVYALIANGGLKFEFRSLFNRVLPLIMIAPVFLYDIWLFKFNDIFKYWSTQGLNANSLPGVVWHYLAFGIIGILAIIRLLQVRSNPLSRNDKFLIIWFLLTFTFIHLGKIFPVIGWSPQIGVYLAVPLALLACSIKYDREGRKLQYYLGMAVIVLCIIASNLGIIMYYTKNFSDPAKVPIFYAGNNEMAAWQWLNKNISRGDVVLAMPATSLRIAKYSDANVVAAHYSVTPRYNEVSGTVVGIYADSLISAKQKPALEKLNVDYIYVGPDEKMLNSVRVEQSDYLTRVYNDPVVSIYKVNRKL